MTPATEYDVVIIGTGPAGLQAAIHASRKKKRVLVLGKQSKSSLFKAHVENFCCLFKVSGEEMLRVGRTQAEGFGTHFLEEDVLSVESKNSGFFLETEGGHALHTYAIIIATGTYRNKLNVPGEKALLGKGVSYCVDCDSNFYRDERVAVIGDESAAADGALTLSEVAASVHLISSTLKANPVLVDKLNTSGVTVLEGVKVKEIVGPEQVKAVILDNGDQLPVTGVFIELGAKGLIELATILGIRLDDEMQFIQTDKKQATNIPGIYAAGDICGPPWQMAKAVGEGCVAGIEAANYAKTVSGA